MTADRWGGRCNGCGHEVARVGCQCPKPDGAEVLRRAAALISERAEAASSEPAWPRRDITQNGTCDACAESKDLVAAYDDPTGENEPWLCADCAVDADFIASWHPAVALAVADFLDTVASRWLPDGIPWPHEVDALAVARAYLGESS